MTRTKQILDDQLLLASGSELRWLAVVLILRVSTNRLTFVNADTKTTLSYIYFLLTLILAVLTLWRLIRLAAQEALHRAEKTGHRQQAESVITLSVWVYCGWWYLFSQCLLPLPTLGPTSPALRSFWSLSAWRSLWRVVISWPTSSPAF